MVAPIRYLSRREISKELGVTDYSEDRKTLEVIGKVGIGTTVFDVDLGAKLQVNGSIFMRGDVASQLSDGRTGIEIGAGSPLTGVGTAHHRIRSAGGSGQNLMFEAQTADVFEPGGDIVFKTGGTGNRLRILKDGNIGIGVRTPTAKLTINPLTTLPVDGTVSPASTTQKAIGGVSIANSENKIYPSSNFNATLGLYQENEIGGITTYASGNEFIYGSRNVLVKRNDNTQDIYGLRFTGTETRVSWTDQNTAHQIIAEDSIIEYLGADANGRTSNSFRADSIFLQPADGATQTINNVQSSNSVFISPLAGINTVNINTLLGFRPSIPYVLNIKSGTHDVNITDLVIYDTGSDWGTIGSVGTVTVDIDNYYGLRLNEPIDSTGLTVTNNYGVYSGWSESKNYFAGDVGIGTDNPTSPLTVKEVSNVAIELLKTNNTSVLTLGEDGNSGGNINAPNGALLLSQGGTERLRITSDGNVGIGTDNPTAKLTINPLTTLSTSGDIGGVSIANTENKTYPTATSFNVTLGLNQDIEVGGTQVIDPSTPGGFNFISGISNFLVKNNNNTQDIERSNYYGFNQNFDWNDANTCKQYVGIQDGFQYSGIDTNGRKSSFFIAGGLTLNPPDGGTQTIDNTESKTLFVGSTLNGGISTVNITNASGYITKAIFTNFTSGTHNRNITNYSAYDTSLQTGPGSGTLNATITNYYGLRLNEPINSTGLTITNNYGVYSGWSESKNYFAGDVGIGTDNPTAKLDVAGITKTEQLNVTGVSTFQGNVQLLDNDRLRIGGSVGNFDGLELFHIGNNSYISDSGTGNLRVLSNKLEIKNAADDEHLAIFNQNGSVELYHDNSKKFETTGAGVTVFGTTQTQQLNVTGVSTFQGDVRITDDDKLRFGTSSGGILQIYTNGNNSFFKQTSGDLKYELADQFIVQKDSGDEPIAIFNSDSDVELYYDGSKKFETTGYGVTVFGTTQTQQLNVTGVSTFQGNVNLGDNDQIIIGDGPDLKLYHDGSNSYVEDTGVGALIMKGSTIRFRSTTNENIINASQNGSVDLYYDNSKKFETTASGIDVTGHTETDTLRVSGVSTFQGNVDLGNGDKINLGDGQDLQIFHDGSNNYILGSNGDIVLKNPSSDYFRAFSSTGAVQINYDGNKKFETTGTGVSISNGNSDTATIAAPSNLIIDPAVVGDNTGIVRIKGDLFVDGTTTQINSTTLEIADFIVGIASTATTDLLADGAGIQIGPDNTLLYEHNGGTNPSLKSSENLNVASGKGYQINQTEVLNATTLGSGVTNSSLTSVGTLSSLNVSGVSTFQGNVDLGSGDRLRLGDGQDLQIYHGGLNGIIENTTGSLFIRDNGNNVFIQGIGGENSGIFRADGAVELYHDNTKKFETTGYGVTVFGTTESQQLSVSGLSTFQSHVHLGDDDELRLGDGNDLKLWHNGSNSIINDEGVGDLYLGGNSSVNITNAALSEFKAKFITDGAVELYHDASKKFETTGAGVTVFGTTESQQLNVSGISTFQNNVNIEGANSVLDVEGHIYADHIVGANRELYIRGGGVQSTRPTIHLPNGTNPLSILGSSNNTQGIVIDSRSTGVVDIKHNSSTKLQTTGYGVTVFGTTQTQQLNVSGVSTFQDNVNLGDNDRLRLGDGNDLQIFHGGSNSFIQDTGTGNLFVAADPDVQITNSSTVSKKAIFRTGGAVELYYDNSKKFETTGYGVTVSGGLNVTGVSTIAGTLTVGNSPFVTSPGHLIRDVGHLVTRRDGAKAPVYSVYDGELFQSNIKIEFENDGSAFFMNSVGIGTTNPNSAVSPSNNRILHTGIVTSRFYYGDGSNLTGISAGQVGALTDIVFDTTPQLGGDLDLNSNDITGTGNIDITGNFKATGISTFTNDIFAESTLTVGPSLQDATYPTDQGTLAVYSSGGKNALIIQTLDNTNSRGIAFRNSGDAYIGYISMENRGSNLGDMVFGVSDSTETNVNNVEERVRFTKDGDVGIGSVTPTEKLDVAGNIAINQTTVVGSATFSLSTVTETAIHTGLLTSTYRSVEYNIQATQGTNFHVTKILALHNGTTAYHNEYGTIFNNTSVSTFNVDVSGGNIRLLATGASASQTDYVINFTATKI